MIRDYFEITRLFNMGFTAVAPVLGALSLWTSATINLFDLLKLSVLFAIGCLSHAYGFILNDIVDINVDKLSTELTARPLVSGNITKKRASFFAVACLVVSFILSFMFYSEARMYIVIVCILGIAYLFATVYDVMSKKYPGMDIFVAGAVFFLILFGASTIGTPTLLSWIIAFIGGLQVLFMNMINGAIKDIDHDKEGKANTVAIRLGAKVHAGIIALPLSFKTTGYLIEVARLILLILPFTSLMARPLPLAIWQIILIAFFEVLIFVSIYKLYSIKTFDRARIRKCIGITVILMYTTTPIMLSSLNILILLAALIPPAWFVGSNLIFHKTLLEPKTM